MQIKKRVAYWKIRFRKMAYYGITCRVEIDKTESNANEFLVYFRSTSIWGYEAEYCKIIKSKSGLKRFCRIVIADEFKRAFQDVLLNKCGDCEYSDTDTESNPATPYSIAYSF